MLTAEEIIIILDAVGRGTIGYQADPRVAALQAKLSIMLEMARKRAAHG